MLETCAVEMVRLPYDAEEFAEFQADLMARDRQGLSPVHDTLDVGRPVISGALHNPEAAPAAIDLLVDLALPADRPFSDDAAARLSYSVGQIASVDFDRLRELAGHEDRRLANRAMWLLYHSTGPCFPMSDESDKASFLIEHLPDAVQQLSSEPALLPPGSLDTYLGAAQKLAWHTDAQQLSTLIGTVHEMAGLEETRPAGEALQRSLIESVAAPLSAARQADVRSAYPDKPFRLFYAIRTGQMVDRIGRYSFGHNEAEMDEVDAGVDALYQDAREAGAEEDVRQMLYAAVSHAPRFGGAKTFAAELALHCSGLDTAALEAGWRAGRGEADEEDYFIDNLQVIAEIERNRPGATKTLMDRFFLRNFARLPADVYIRQYDERNDKTRPYGIFDIAQRDHAGSFLTNGILPEQARQLVQNLDDHNQLLRVYELSNLSQGLRSLFDARHRYRQPLTFFWGLAHSNGNKADLNYPKRTTDTITPHDIRRAVSALDRDGRERPHHERIADLFAEGATGILDACSTGKKRGLAEYLAALFNIKFTAPTEPTYLTSVTVAKAPDTAPGLRLTPEYKDPVAREIEPQPMLLV